jgi:hypothetical protein
MTLSDLVEKLWRAEILNKILNPDCKAQADEIWSEIWSPANAPAVKTLIRYLQDEWERPFDARSLNQIRVDLACRLGRPIEDVDEMNLVDVAGVLDPAFVPAPVGDQPDAHSPRGLTSPKQRCRRKAKPASKLEKQVLEMKESGQSQTHYSIADALRIPKKEVDRIVRKFRKRDERKRKDS